ncbi:MAG: hypothetical protein QG657_1560 [Acidobacteriota bacterium]|nr:hypothetical protein [Acidobacteriota bacterium]
MMNILSKNPLVKKIVDGEAGQDLITMLLDRQLPFTEEEYLESLVFLLKDEAVKDKALARLKEIPENVRTAYVEKLEANHRVAYYVIMEALSKKNQAIIARAIRNQALPYEFLSKIAAHGDIHMLEALLDNQIKLIAYPVILEEIEKNAQATAFIKGKIKEFREFYLAVEAEEIPAEQVLEEVKEILIQEQAEQAKQAEQQEAAKDGAETGEDEEGSLQELDKVEHKALTVLQEINRMTISERVKLALAGSKTQRMILIKDANKMVSMAVLESPKIGIDEVLLLARDRSVAGEIIARVAQRRDWTKNYNVVLELVQNPKTPIKDALSFVKQLHVKDLQLLSRDKNVNATVRQLALNYHREKSSAKQ